MSRDARWYGNLTHWAGPTGVVQTGSVVRRERRDGPLRLPEPVLRLAQHEYDVQFPGQPYERMQERGGLSLLEIIGLLADALERERRARVPTSWPGEVG